MTAQFATRRHDRLKQRPEGFLAHHGRHDQQNWALATALIQIQNLARIHPIIRVQRPLQRPHYFQPFAMLSL